MTSYQVDAMLDEMAAQIREYCEKKHIEDPFMLGIHTGGAWIAEKLHHSLNLKKPLGSLNISFYRDDFTRIGVHPQVKPSNLPASVEGESIILVDDVLYTGRTIRAAINEIFDYGRPRLIGLAVLINRDGRELPIQADIIGSSLSLKENQQIKLTGPSPLELNITD